MMHGESRDMQDRHGEMTNWQDPVSMRETGNDGASCPRAVFTLRVHDRMSVRSPRRAEPQCAWRPG